MGWRVARSLDTLLEQINELAPSRSTISDGSIGDAAHATRDSDHNPWCGPGVVTARDYTHDPDAGADMHKIAEALRQSRDPRIKYVIWDKRMFSSYPTSTSSAWEWRPYTGINLHTQHMHVSVNCAASQDSTVRWNIQQQEKDWFDMADKEDLKKIVKEAVDAATKDIKAELVRQRKLLAVGEERAYEPAKVNIKSAIPD